MSVSMIPTRLPVIAAHAEILAVRFDFPVPPRKEWIEMIFDKYFPLVPRNSLAQLASPALERPEILGLHDGRYLPSLLRFVDLDLQLADVILQFLLPHI